MTTTLKQLVARLNEDVVSLRDEDPRCEIAANIEAAILAIESRGQQPAKRKTDVEFVRLGFAQYGYRQGTPEGVAFLRGARCATTPTQE